MEKINTVKFNYASEEGRENLLLGKVNELVEFADGLQKLAEKQEIVK